MLHNAWYAVAWSEEVGTRPIQKILHGVAFVIYRTQAGTICAVDGHCPHRGCDLSLGKVISNHLVCPYHGWEFDDRGRCTHIPANRHQTTVQQVRPLGTYATCEALGLVWVWMSSSLQPDLLQFPCIIEVSDDSWHRIVLHQRWHAHFTRVVESVLDVSHLPFVHPEQTGTDVDPAVLGPEYQANDSHIIIYPRPFASAHPMEPSPYASDEDVRTEIELWYPNHWMIRTPVGAFGMMCTYLTFTPVNEQVTDIFGLAIRNFEPENEFLDAYHVEHTYFVMSQDQRIIESIRPLRAPFDLQKEAHVASDAPTIRYRRWLHMAWENEQKS